MSDTSDTGSNETAVVSAEYDWTTVSPTTAIVESVAEAKGVEARAIDPLYGYVDPDALESLLRKDLGIDGNLAVRFTFDGYVVRLAADGSLSVFE